MAIATRASVMWLNNSRRLLGRRLHRTPAAARWWGLVRVLNAELGISLKFAAQAADTVLAPGFQPSRLRLSVSTDLAVTLQIDLERFHSTANALLASALAFAPEKRRGRRPTRPVVAGNRPDFTPPHRIRVENDPQKLERLAADLRARGARPRGIENALGFIMDGATLRSVQRLALTTRTGDVDVVVVPPALP